LRLPCSQICCFGSFGLQTLSSLPPGAAAASRLRRRRLAAALAPYPNACQLPGRTSKQVSGLRQPKPERRLLPGSRPRGGRACGRLSTCRGGRPCLRNHAKGYGRVASRVLLAAAAAPSLLPLGRHHRRCLINQLSGLLPSLAVACGCWLLRRYSLHVLLYLRWPHGCCWRKRRHGLSCGWGGLWRRATSAHEQPGKWRAKRWVVHWSFAGAPELLAAAAGLEAAHSVRRRRECPQWSTVTLCALPCRFRGPAHHSAGQTGWV